MIVVLADLLADLSLHISRFPVVGGSMQPLTYLEIGPGGACNVAIAAARLGLEVACLGEVGDDRFGQIVLEGLRQEGIDVSGMVVSAGVRTPVAGVLVDQAGEPAYLGFRGDLRLAGLQDAWRQRIGQAQALFADGWAEHQGIAGLVLAGLLAARTAGAVTFFDPGPGNPRLDNGWHQDALALTKVLLVNEPEAARLSGLAEPEPAGRALLARGPELVVVKLGAEGCLLLTAGQVERAPGFPVELVDATGAGDSLAGAVIYGYLRGLNLPVLAVLANAAGAAKVQKRGTGHNVPTREEIAAVLERFGRRFP